MDSLNLEEEIRINKFIRNKIDFQGFKEWFDSEPRNKQNMIVSTLCEYTQQAGITDEGIDTSFNKSGLNNHNKNIEYLLKLKISIDEIEEWFENLNKVERDEILKFCVYLFGITEGEVYKKEIVQGCNHWWHRDLLDSRVVSSLLKNPEYWSTSMVDDKLIKKPKVSVFKRIYRHLTRHSS